MSEKATHDMARKSSKASESDEKIADTKPKVSGTREFIEMFIEVLIIVLFINAFLMQSETIPSSSMEDNMLIGDHLMVDKVAYAPSWSSWDTFIFPRLKIGRGMIVTFKGPPELEKEPKVEKEYVKRVIGLPGETIRLDDKKVYINGKPLDEPYVFFKGGVQLDSGDHFPLSQPRIVDAIGTTTYLPFYLLTESQTIDLERTANLCERFKDCLVTDASGALAFKIPQGYYFCMGDNRDYSYDCRYWGPVPADYIVGKPWRNFWSYESTSEEYLSSDKGKKAEYFFSTFLKFIPKTRWKRTLMRF